MKKQFYHLKIEESYPHILVFLQKMVIPSLIFLLSFLLKVGPGSVLRGPLQNATTDAV